MRSLVRGIPADYVGWLYAESARDNHGKHCLEPQADRANQGMEDTLEKHHCVQVYSRHLESLR